jgi:hypothetical protein
MLKELALVILKGAAGIVLLAAILGIYVIVSLTPHRPAGVTRSAYDDSGAMGPDYVYVLGPRFTLLQNLDTHDGLHTRLSLYKVDVDDISAVENRIRHIRSKNDFLKMSVGEHHRVLSPIFTGKESKTPPWWIRDNVSRGSAISFEVVASSSTGPRGQWIIVLNKSVGEIYVSSILG